MKETAEDLFNKITALDKQISQLENQIKKGEKVTHLLNRYGPDFFKKCKHYKTATKIVKDELLGAKAIYLGLVSFDEKTLEFEAYEAGSSIIFKVSVFDLDNFVL